MSLLSLVATGWVAGVRAQGITVDIASDDVDVDWQNATVANLPGPDGKISFLEALIASNHTPGRQRIAFAIRASR